MKAFLDSESIPYNPADSDAYLRTKAAKRIRKLERSNFSTAQRQALFKQDQALSLKELVARINEINDSRSAEVEFVDAKVMIEEMAPIIVKAKHQVGKHARCRGNVINNMCMQCNTATVGINAYSFTVVLRDLKDSEFTYKITAGPAAGLTLFGMEADAFAALEVSAAQDRIEGVEGEAYCATFRLEFDVQKDEVWPLATSMLRLPSSEIQ